MPRRPRLVLPEVPLHVIQWGNNCQICFVTDADCRCYLEWLREYAEKARVGALTPEHLEYVPAGEAA